MNKIALVTGATSGIGKATAYLFAKKGWDIIITGRRQERLSEIANDIKKHFNCDVLGLHFDIRDKRQTKEALSGIPKWWKDIDLLVNNAGLASGLDYFEEGSIEDWEKMVDTNVKGLLYISREVIPLMVKRGKGQIINVSSLAGKEVYPKGAVYTATKHAVDAITKGMRMDLIEKNIKVSSVSPGLVETEFSIVRFHGDEEKAKKVYEGFQPLTAKDIADAIHYIASVPDHVNIADMLILAKRQASSTIVYRNNAEDS